MVSAGKGKGKAGEGNGAQRTDNKGVVGDRRYGKARTGRHGDRHGREPTQNYKALARGRHCTQGTWAGDKKKKYKGHGGNKACHCKKTNRQGGQVSTRHK